MCYIPALSVLGTLRQEDLNFKAILGYIARTCLKKEKAKCTDLLLLNYLKLKGVGFEYFGNEFFQVLSNHDLSTVSKVIIHTKLTNKTNIIS